VQAHLADPASMLELYRAALRLRRQLPALGTDAGEGDPEWVDTGNGMVAFRRGPDFLCVLNPGEAGVPLPAGEVLLASAPVLDGVLPVDAAAWVAVP
jgi:alpha-glucosidase